jgi:hypothetical protein
VTHRWSRADEAAVPPAVNGETPEQLDAAVAAARRELDDAIAECLRLKPPNEAFVPLRPGRHDPSAPDTPYGDARRRAAVASVEAEAAIDRRSAAR